MVKAQAGRKKALPEFAVEVARADMKELLNRVEFHGERIVVTRYGKPSVAWVSMADLDRLEKAS